MESQWNGFFLSYCLPRTPSYFTPTMTTCREKAALFSLSIASHWRLFWHLYKERIASFQRSMSMAEEHFQFLEQTRSVFRQIENILQHHALLSDTLWKNVEEKLLVA